MVEEGLAVLAPVNLAELLGDFRSGFQFRSFMQLVLLQGLHFSAFDFPYGFHNDLVAQSHQLVVELAGGFIGADGHFLTPDVGAFVDFFVEEEGRQSSLGFPIDDSEVDGCRATVLREQRGVEVERAKLRHLPNHGWQHPESHHNK